MNELVKYPRNGSVFTDWFDDEFFTPHDVLMDRVFSKLFPNSTKELGGSFFESRAYPRVDVRETDAEFILEAEVPGLSKDQVKVEVKNDTLFVRGEKREDEKKEGKYNVREIKRSSFIRTFSLPPDVVDKDKIKAKFKEGILEVRIGKVKTLPPPKPDVKMIDVE